MFMVTSVHSEEATVFELTYVVTETGAAPLMLISDDTVEDELGPGG
jgi:hypothetical protein